MDPVLQFAGDPPALTPVVKRGGVLVSTIALDRAQVPAPDIRVVPIYAHPNAATLEQLARNHAEGRPSVTVQRVYDLEQTPQALKRFAGGKLVIAID